MITTILSLACLALLAGMLTACALKYGVPAMVSDVYYQLEADGRRGWAFSVVLAVVGMVMMACLLDTGKGIQAMAFLGCGSMVFVALAPNYTDTGTYLVHKSAATIAAIGCVGWCLSACWWPTVAVLAAYLVLGIRKHPWYWAETAAMADVFITYFIQ